MANKNEIFSFFFPLSFCFTHHCCFSIRELRQRKCSHTIHTAKREVKNSRQIACPRALSHISQSSLGKWGRLRCGRR